MKAIQITAPSEMKVVDIEKPALKPGEVLVKIKYVGFCGSDLNTFLGRNPMVKLPVIPGHEVGAIIEAIGKDVPESLKPGMSVTVNPYTNCGKCACEMIKAERNKICSRKQTRMLFLAGVVLIVAYFFFFQFNYQNVFYDYDLEKMALASGFTAIEQRKEVAEIFEGKLSQNTLLTMQEKIDQAKQATVGQDENSAFSAVHVYRDQAAILEYLTNSDGSFKSLETAYPNSPTVTLGYCDGWDKLLSGMGSILSIMICLIVVITLSPVFSEEYALHTDSIIYSARYGRTKLTTSKIIAALEVVIGTYLLYLLLNLVLYGCTYGLQGWNVSIQSSLHYASSIYNLTFLQMFFISVILNIFGIVALTTITLFLSAQMSSPVTALITSCVICFLPVVFDFNDSLPVLQKMQEICPIFMLHTNGIFSDMKTYFGMSQPVFMIILNVGLIFVFYRLTKNISKKHQVTG